MVEESASRTPFGVYNGIREDVRILRSPDFYQEQELRIAIPYAILDFPFSLIGDTLLLPLDIYILTSTDEIMSWTYPPFTNAIPNVSDEVLSNALAYYVLYETMENGRKIDTPDFANEGYIHPKPEVIITNIVSFSVNLPEKVLYPTGPKLNWHVYGLGRKPFSAFSITLHTKDAQNIATLEQAYQTKHNFLFMLDNKPLAGTYLYGAYDSSIRPPKKPQTIYLPLRAHQDILEISNALQRLVHP